VGGNPFRRVKNELPGGQPDSRFFESFQVSNFGILLHKTLDLEWFNNIRDIILGWIFDHKPFT
jgi:hypothetical protein